MKRPTQMDVARKAGVSRATVSLIINDQANGKVRISAETQARVKAAVAELGYRPNGVAQSLRRQRTNLLALLVPDITNPYYPLVIRGAQAIADQYDYQLLIFDSDDNPAREQSFIDTVLRRRVDGVLMVSFHLQPDDVSKLLAAGIEVVILGNYFDRQALPVSRTSYDLHPAISALITHLVAKGHKRIAHIAGPQDTPPGRERLRSYQQALVEANLSFDPKLVQYGSFRREGIAPLIETLLDDNHADPPTAIFAANDLMGIETIQVLTDLGYRVPGDIAVCGFDDIPQSAWITPALTTIGQNPFLQGERAATMLLNRLQSSVTTEIEQAIVACELVIRAST